MGTIADHLRALRDQVEFYDALSDFIRLVDAVEELERVNDDLENQIHEDGGFIQRIVDLEEENSQLRADSAVFRGLAIAYQASILETEQLAFAYIAEAENLKHPLTKELVKEIGRDILKALIGKESDD